jgi:hypothetical protein
MARFKAYDSDSEDESSSSSSEVEVLKPKSSAPARRRLHPPNDDEDMSSSDSDSSRMDEKELVLAATKNTKPETNGKMVRRQPSASSSRTPSRSPSPRPPHVHQAKTRPDPTVISRAQQLGVEAQRVHNMQTALFRMPEEEAALKALTQPKRTLRLQLNRKHSRESDGDGLRLESIEVCAVLWFTPELTRFSATVFQPRCRAYSFPAHTEICACRKLGFACQRAGRCHGGCWPSIWTFIPSWMGSGRQACPCRAYMWTIKHTVRELILPILVLTQKLQ